MDLVARIEDQSESDQDMMNIFIDLQIEEMRKNAEAYRRLAKSFNKDGLGNLGHKHSVWAMAIDIMIELIEDE